jgi:hypothetical protein
MLRTAWLVVLLVGLGIGTVVSQVDTAPWSAVTDHVATAKHKHKHNDKQKSLPPYTVQEAGSGNANQSNSASASCDQGDEATGGGFESVDQPTTRIVDNSPFGSIINEGGADTWTVVYTNGNTSDPVTAIVICTDLGPKHT